MEPMNSYLRKSSNNHLIFNLITIAFKREITTIFSASLQRWSKMVDARLRIHTPRKM